MEDDLSELRSDLQLTREATIPGPLANAPREPAVPRPLAHAAGEAAVPGTLPHAT